MKPGVRDALADLKERLGARLTVVDFRVYGSTARGTASDESDIDMREGVRF
ncbi:MAG: nucleotidyltransferase domain-containing protein [Deltaproteobacteria bacterium]|nr:nucleotidyltransferase domain-containing protein [Deltaproteobacteria bacterium]